MSDRRRQRGSFVTRPPAAPEGLYAVRADQPMVPASTLKLVTTAACFDRFGPEWRIKTYVGHVPSAGTDARYDLAVIGGGDPNFSGRFWGGDPVAAFRKWAETLWARGLTAVGRVVLDDSLFDGVLQHPHWPANQRADWYEAPVSALTVNDSCVDIHVSPGRPGEPAGAVPLRKADKLPKPKLVMRAASTLLGYRRVNAC